MKRDAAVRVLLAFSIGFVARADAQATPPNEDGYDLWLRYRLVSNASLLTDYRATIARLVVDGDSPTLRAARDELSTGLQGLLGRRVPTDRRVRVDGSIVVGTPASSHIVAALPLAAELARVGREGFVIRATTVSGKRAIVVAANSDVGALYGAFRLLRQLQTNGSLRNLSISSAPRIQLRMLDHWDNLDRTVERGYAGESLWEWQRLPDSLSPRYRDYARANASIGING
ncbi:MAG TPA: alpha-glucuronidase family glycosyl hydrolase, partial [Gemmatimonadaceae bacterium]|nr:alpha-glucuronidase family glycosyl hydrolase [Gemmatimonadaceae bacterium]